MFKQKEWIFEGGSGKEYKFEIHSKSATFPAKAGAYILSYTHPRGHRAGFESHILFIDYTWNLRENLKNQPTIDCLAHECWNCIFVLESEDKKALAACVADLMEREKPICQS